MNNFSPYAYDGLERGATFPVDEETKKILEVDHNSHERKAVTIKDGVATFGASGDPVHGIIEKVEPFDTKRKTYNITVGFAKSFERVPVGDTPPISGGGLAVDGKGGVISGDTMTAYCWLIESGGKTATIKVL